MATQLERSAAGQAASASPTTDALNTKLHGLSALGLEVQWIEAGRMDLTCLVVEGGETAIRLDPDPSIDRAWFGDIEIRHCAARDGVWIFVKGEVASGEISAHQVALPNG